MPIKAGWWDVHLALQNLAETIKLNSTNRQEFHPVFQLKEIHKTYSRFNT